MRNFLKFVDITFFIAAIILLIGTAYTQWDYENCNTVSLLSIGMIVVLVYAKLFIWIMTGRLTFKK